MTHQGPTTTWRFFEPLLALAVAAALLFSAVSPAAAPPSLPSKPEERGPALIPFVPLTSDGFHMFGCVLGGASQIHFAPISAFSYLVAGETSKAWSLEGPLTRMASRTSLGVGTLVGNGLPIDGLSPFTLLVTLQAGANVDCWQFIDTDKFRGLPESWLGFFIDSTAVFAGGEEARIYADIVTRANYTSKAAFLGAVRPDISYTHVFEEPGRYRGKVMLVEGRLLRVKRYDPPHAVALRGVNDLYEAWIYNDQLGANPFVCVFTEWNSELSPKLLSMAKIDENIRVSFAGYFIKKFRYTAIDRKATSRDAPMLIGHGLDVLNKTGTSRASSTFVTTMIYTFIGIVLGLIFTVIGLTYWFRRSDNRVRQRILAHMPEFALPPPDAPPQIAAPVAAPVMPVNGHDRSRAPHKPRVTFPLGSSDSGAKSEKGEGEGTDGGTEKPPDEGAAAKSNLAFVIRPRCESEGTSLTFVQTNENHRLRV